MFTLGAMLLLLAKGSGNRTVEAIILVASLVLATVAIGLGPGSVPYTLVGELFPPEYRTLGSCVVLVVRSLTIDMKLQHYYVLHHIWTKK